MKNKLLADMLRKQSQPEKHNPMMKITIGIDMSEMKKKEDKKDIEKEEGK